jgi:hypothetical protein
MSDNIKPAGYDSDGKPYFKEDNSNASLTAAEQSLPPPPPVPTTPAPPLSPEPVTEAAVNEPIAEAAVNEPVTEAAVNEPATEAAVNEPVTEASATAPTDISNLSNDINLNISAMIEPNKPAKIGEIKTNEHSLKFSPEIDLVNPTAALDRLSAGIKKIINANAGDPLILDEAYAPPAPQVTRVQKAKNVVKNAFKGVSGLFNRTNKVAQEPIDDSVRNAMQPGGRRGHTKKNRKHRITKSNRKKVRPSRRR